MRIFWISGAATAIILNALVVNPASATTVESVSGNVVVNTGNGYKPAKSSTAVTPGTLVAARSGGSAVIVYDNGCTESVAEGAVVTVKPTISCSAGAAGFGGAGPLLVGAAVIGGAVGIAAAVSDDNDKSASQ